MIPIQDALELQAFVDGELPPSQAAAVARRLETDAEARSLSDNLRATRGLLREAELSTPVEDSREFYWASIRRAIDAAERSAVSTSTPFRFRWRAIWQFAAATCAVVVAAALLVLPRNTSGRGGETWLAVDQEIESPLENANTFSFRSETARMTVVWVNTQVN
jgi:anti-sigma factor RsiW